MSHALDRFLTAVNSKNLISHFNILNRGLEKESLRIDNKGFLAQTPHPSALGSALTHTAITTDYAEALIEYVTPVHHNIDDLLLDLTDWHRFTYQNLDQEKLWVNSMPCILKGEQSISIARYGSSNIAKMKEAYRRGLSHRYGRTMQSIAGIHLNFSMPDAFWPEYLEQPDTMTLGAAKTDHYFALIRNFHRCVWLPCYLFGASPAVCRTFLEGRAHNLEHFDANSFYAPYATSLRLSGLGYSNQAQAGIEICYNDLDRFIKTLKQAIETPMARYQRIGVKVNGVYRQLNANLLQIENEYYATIRPKRIAASGESPINALAERGVEYIEVRSLDLNPFSPVGIDADCIRFFDMLLLYCMFSDSPHISARDNRQFKQNQQSVVMQGRRPGLTLIENDTEQSFELLAASLLQQLQPVAELLDQAHQSNEYHQCLQRQQEKLENPSKTPSAAVLEEMAQNHYSFYEFALHQASAHEKYFRQNQLRPAKQAKFSEISTRSIEQQKEIEASDNCDFDTFLANYYQRNQIKARATSAVS